MSFRLPSLFIGAALTFLAGCATPPRHADVVSDAHIVAAAKAEPLTTDTFAANTVEPVAGSQALRSHSEPHESSYQPPKPEVQIGTGKFIDEATARKAVATGGGEGQVNFNFENNPIQAVVKAILGDLLQQNYTIAPNVGGNVSFSTSRPIRTDQAMGILEMLLSWTGNTLIYKDGRYTVLQFKDALPGNLTPRVAPPNLARGYEVRVFPVSYVSPTEMAKLLKPYAKADAFINIDTARSMLVLAGTAAELENYQQTIDVFDVDWLKGMSIGVFTLQRVEVATLIPELDKIFGTAGESPLAGMFRFIPIERSNALVVITPQPEYLRSAEEWLHRLDRAGDESATQLYVYDVKNIKSLDLADYLGEIFVGGSSGGSRRSSTSGSVAPGLSAVTVGGIGGSGGAAMSGSARTGRTPRAELTAATPAGEGAAGIKVGEGDSNIRITAVEESNQLLVMATPNEWDSMQGAIRRLDIAPLQVHIETKILEVSLNGALEYGVKWWFAGLKGEGYDGKYVNRQGVEYPNAYDRQRSLLGSVGPLAGGSNIFYSYLNSKFQVALSALENSGQAKVLSAPSLVVMNNTEASINVGQQIPVVQTYNSYPYLGGGGNNNTGSGTGNQTSSFGNSGTVQYLNTGVVLQVRPRVNPGGLVYMEVSQEVSKPGPPAAGSNNPPINQRQLQTQIAVQSGETILLGGLISEDSQDSNDGVPGLRRVPVLGKLFSSTKESKQRTELIVLITPQVMTNTAEARQVTEDYKLQFQGLDPLRAKTVPGVKP